MKKLVGLLAVGAILAVPATASAGDGAAYGKAVQETLAPPMVRRRTPRGSRATRRSRLSAPG